MKTIEQFSMKDFYLNGKTAIVTGGNKGIGQALAVALAEGGADVFIVSRSNDWAETEKIITGKGRRFGVAHGDLSDRSFRSTIIDQCIADMGQLDILVNNAGTIRRAPLVESKFQDWEDVLEINLTAAYDLSQLAIQKMVPRKSGKIINVCSLLSFQGGKFVPSYTASKHAIAGITKAFANELAIENIQVNGIAPGYIATDNTKALREDANRYAEIVSRIPAGEFASPADLMGAAVFLASDAARYVNGHILAVDGGWLAR